MTLKSQIILARSGLIVTVLVIFFLATTARQIPVVESINDKLNHFLAFFVLSLQLDFAFPSTKSTYYQKYVALLSYGILLECVQNFLPHRDFSIADVAADIAGILGYICTVPVIQTLPILKKRWRS